MIYGDKMNVDRDYENRQIFCLSGKWLHGKIEELNGCDYCYCDSKEQDEYYATHEVVEDIKVVLEGNDNKEVNAKIFTWFVKEIPYITEGLIVLSNNTKGLREAQICFDNKRFCAEE